MTGVRFAYRAVLAILLICQLSTCLAAESPDPTDPNRYLDAVRTFADNVFKYGRDTYFFVTPWSGLIQGVLSLYECKIKSSISINCVHSKGIYTMNAKLVFTFVLPVLLLCSSANAQKLTSDIPYVENGHERHVLDIYMPEEPTEKSLPVMFWIHGGGWQTGDKSDVALKPKSLTERGFVFVSTNYRLLPEVKMEDLIGDVAKSLGWVHKHIARYGGDPERIFVGGHSAGAQLAALICIDDRYLKKEGVSFDVFKGCVPVDGDTYDIPKIIMTAEHRQALYGGKMFTFGHRQKFGNDPEKHVDFSAVTHVAKDKGIPPFLILYFSGNPDTRAQARRLESVLKEADIPAKAYGKSDSNHSRLNNDLGRPDDPATQEFYKFLDSLVGGER